MDDGCIAMHSRSLEVSLMIRALVCAVALGFLVTACSKKEDKAADGVETSSATESAVEALVESFPAGALAWRIDPDGKVRAEVRDKDGANTSKTAAGTIEWVEGTETKTTKLAFDESAKALVGIGPSLKADVTPIKYAVLNGTEPMSGTLQVPVGGTPALIADAKTADTPSAAGPNGGVVQVVGEDKVEIVADDESDEIRVYVLDANGKPTAPGDRKITLAVNGDSNDVIVLTPSADGVFLVGAWKGKGDPSRITVVVRRPSGVHVAIVGWKPGTRLMIVGGPKWKVKKPKGWQKAKHKDKDKDDDDDDGPGHGRGKGHGNGKGKK